MKLCLFLLCAICSVGTYIVKGIFKNSPVIIHFEKESEIIQFCYEYRSFFCLSFILTVYASKPNCPMGTIERIRFNADPPIIQDEEDDENRNENEYNNFFMETYIKVDTIEGECYTKIIDYQPLLLRAFSAYPFGIQTQPHSLNCLSGSTNLFQNFTLTRE